MTWPLLLMFDTGNHGHIGWAVAMSNAIAGGYRDRRHVLSHAFAALTGQPQDWSKP